VYGDGTQTRAFCHVADAVWALGRLMDEPRSRGQVFNVGNDREVRIGDLAGMIRRLAGSSSEIRLVPYQEAYGAGFEDMARRVPDLAKIRGLIGYQPRHSLEETVGDIIAWMRERGARGCENAC